MSIFDPSDDVMHRDRSSTEYFSAQDQFLRNSPQALIEEEPEGVVNAPPTGILKSGKSRRGGVKWRDENPDEDAPAERIKHFDFLDEPSKIAEEAEYGGDQFTVPDDTREHPWYKNQKAMFNHRATANAQRRKNQVFDMAVSLPRAEANANTFAQDLGTDEALTRPKADISPSDQDEMDELLASDKSARKMQNAALGVKGYRPEDRKQIVDRAKVRRGKPGFFSSLMGSFGLDRLFGSRPTQDRTFDAVPRSRGRGGWFQRLFGTSGRAGR